MNRSSFLTEFASRTLLSSNIYLDHILSCRIVVLEWDIRSGRDRITKSLLHIRKV